MGSLVFKFELSLLQGHPELDWKDLSGTGEGH